MVNRKRCWVLILIVAVQSVSGCSQDNSQTSSKTPNESTATTETNPTTTQSKYLVTPTWLANNIRNPNVVLLGLGQTESEFKQGHIPGERFVAWKTDISDSKQSQRFNLPPAAQLEHLLGELGVSNDSTVVLTDTMTSRLSTRMSWTLYCYGHRNMKILDGGQKAWLASGKKLTQSVETWKTTKYKAGPLQTLHRIQIKEIRAAIEREPQAKLIDGRPVKQFQGLEPGRVFHTHKPHQRLGHIPRAKNIFWKENFDQDGRFKSIAELNKLYDSYGIKHGDQVISYCNEGLHAVPAWFVLSILLERDNVQVYDDSMSEWANRNDTPLSISQPKSQK